MNENVSGSNNAELVQKERELRDLDDQVNDLNEELSTLSKQGDIRAKLSLKRSDKESKEAVILKLYVYTRENIHDFISSFLCRYQGRIDDVEKLIKSRPAIENFEKELYAYKTYSINITKETTFVLKYILHLVIKRTIYES